MLEVALSPIPGELAQGPRLAYLRELRGRDELALADVAPAAMSELLTELLVDVPGAAIGPGTLASATVGERDLLVAALYQRAFGDQVESQIECRDCGRPFEVRFSLAEEIAIATHAAEETARREPADGPDQDGFYRLPGGVAFRLPTVGDERQLAAVPAAERRQALLGLCVRVESEAEAIDPEARAEMVERAMAARDPGASPAIGVPCALCRAPQTIDLDIVDLFLAAVARERPVLAREIHALASAYRWSFQEIIDLPRGQRHAQVELCEMDREALGGALP